MYRKPGGNHVDPAHGKLAVLLPGMGAVATTFIAGVDAVRRGKASPVGSLSQLGFLPQEGAGDQEGQPLAMGEALPLAALDDLVFGGWDIYSESCYEAAKKAGVLSMEHLQDARACLEGIRPMAAVFDQEYVRNLSGSHTKSRATKMDLVQALVDDAGQFMDTHGCARAVAVWCGSTERFVAKEKVHQDLKSFEKGLRENHPLISPSMIYAYACLQAGIPFANGAPNLTGDCPALVELALREGVALAGKDFKTGQTLLKTILAPGFAARMIGVNGWYSTNILGNSDGAVLDDPGSFRTKEESKLSVLRAILNGETHPELYEDFTHKVRIDYYPPRGDNKEGWDNIDIFGWMGYPMQIKINFLCRDSILAAPLVLDLAMFLDLAQRAGRSGVQEWLSFYFKSPQTIDSAQPEHDLFAQFRRLQETLLELAGLSSEQTLATIRRLNA